MKMFYCSVAVLAIFLAGIIWGVWEILVSEHISEAHFVATRFSVYALIFSVVASTGLICGSVALTTRRSVPYTMAFPWTLGVWIFVAACCIPLAALILESCAPIVLIHACALFFVSFFAFGLLTAASIGTRKEYEVGRRRVFSLREDFRALNELVLSKDFPEEIKKTSARLADDFEYFQESIVASETLDSELEAAISALKSKIENDDVSENSKIFSALSSIRSLAERRERLIKQNR